MTDATIPLLARQPGDPIAIRRGVVVTAAEFLSEANGVAAALPASGSVINVCEDRYRFFVGFAAALARGLTTLLPPNPLANTVNGIQREWPGSVVLGDSGGEGFEGRTVIAEASARGPAANPEIPARLRAAVAFTSGSTGSSAAQAKSWRALVEGTAINLRYFLGAGAGPFSVVSTVPAQHMYGLETTVLGALRGPVILHDGRPFYPANVAAALFEAPAPRVLVSTPVHLRALLGSGLRFPPLARVLSATAPLDPALAGSLEELFGAELIEIYGCTEVGSMASRRTAAGAPWRFFDGLKPSVRDAATWVDAAHLREPVCLPDALEFREDGGFLLAGRDSDLVKIGGKRASLVEVTRLLLGIDGVVDAVVFRLPEGPEDARLAALVVSQSLGAGAVRGALMSVLDPVFIPRPVVIVQALPRSATGKLTRDAVLELYRDAAGAGPSD